MSPKVLAVAGLVALFGSRLTTCRSPGEGAGDASPSSSPKAVEVKGVDSSALTARERADWSESVSALLAPCPDQAVPLAQCVNENRSCKACLPAVRYLLEQVRRGRTRSQVEAAYRERFAPDQIKSIDLTDTPSKGNAGAPIVIVEFADFECPACGAMRPVLDEVYEKHRDAVRLLFKHFPLAMHPNAEKASRAAVAAQRQGKFWEMHRVLFDNQNALSVENIEKHALSIGLDLVKFRQDRDSEATADFVAKNRKQGEALELSGTPSVYINGRRFSGTGDPSQDLEEWIRLELELLGGAPQPAVSIAPARSASAAPAASAPVAPASAAPAGSVLKKP
jgi:protein-disulfide isomerase